MQRQLNYTTAPLSWNDVQPVKKIRVVYKPSQQGMGVQAAAVLRGLPLQPTPVQLPKKTAQGSQPPGGSAAAAKKILDSLPKF